MSAVRLAAVILACASGFAGGPVRAQQQGQGGVLIDAEGVLKTARISKSGGPRSARRSTPRDPTQRVVSLVRLEQACREAGVAVADLPPELETLGGLYLIEEIVLDVEAHDVLLVGPADDPTDRANGRWIGAKTGRPLIRTEDWIVVFRAMASGERQISCSIDPDPERLRQYNHQIQTTAAQVQLATAARWYAQLATILGRQDITIQGVPIDSRFAGIIAQADFCMKRIAIGIDPSGVREIKSQLVFAGRDRGANLQRWWFAPLYEPVNVDAGRSRFHLSGPRVQLLAQEELIAEDGSRRDAATTRVSTQTFARKFTEHFAELVQSRPIFAEMQSGFDLTVAAAIIVREQFPERAGWEPGFWLDADAWPTPPHPAPRFVESESAMRSVNMNTIVGLVGGVIVNPREVLDRERPLDGSRPIPPRAPGEKDFVWTLKPEPAEHPQELERPGRGGFSRPARSGSGFPPLEDVVE